MKLEDYWTDIEADQAWREKELRFLNNKLLELSTEMDRALFRRAIVVMLYAHFEGFCKFAFSLYVRAINEAGIKCSDANYAIAASAMADVFNALRDPFKKCSEFKNLLPDDTGLHRFARDREFIERADIIIANQVNIPDSVIDTESNLKPVVLKKILFRLGFQHDQFEKIEDNINKLLGFRNAIGHGKYKDGLNESQLNNLKEAANSIMSAVKRDVMAAIQERKYLRAC